MATKERAREIYEEVSERAAEIQDWADKGSGHMVLISAPSLAAPSHYSSDEREVWVKAMDGQDLDE